MDNFRRRLGYFYKGSLPKTAVEVPDGTTSGWAKGIYVPVGIYNGVLFLTLDALLDGTEGTLLQNDTGQSPIVMLYQNSILSQTDYSFNYLSQGGSLRPGQSGSYTSGCTLAPTFYYHCGSTGDTSLDTSTLVYGEQGTSHYGNDYYGMYVYLPVKLLSYNDTVLSPDNNGPMNGKAQARKAIGQSNAEYPIYIEPYS